MFNEHVHRFFFLLGTAIITIFLPFSPFLLSAGIFTLVFNWLLEFRYKEKFLKLKSRPSILLIVSIFAIHVIWLINTENFEYAIHDLKIKLPLLSLPIIYGTTSALNKNEFIYILHLFLGTILVATFVSTAIYLGYGNNEVIDNRNISIFISHIRFALMVDLAFYLSIVAIISAGNFRLFPIYIYIGIIVWLLFYILFMAAFSGGVILLLSSPFILVYWLKKQKSLKLRKMGLSLAGLFSIIVLSYFCYSAFRYLSKSEIDIENLPSHTANGNPYKHSLNKMAYENGNLIWILISSKEIKKEWNSISDIKIGEKDQKGQSINTTLIRYLSSLGYTKDSVGISRLLPNDIKMIERGYTNYIFKYKWAIYPRLYEIFWEIESYIKSGNPSGHSLSQRLEFAKNGIGVVKRNFWFGTGTGDVNDEVLHQYKLDDSVLSEKWLFRPHNQYITFFIAFGFIGFCLLFTLTTLGVLKEKQNIDFLFIAFILIILFSMISEDTLETQAGASYFAYFVSLFLYGRNGSE